MISTGSTEPCWQTSQILFNPLSTLPTGSTRSFRVRGTHFFVLACLCLWLLVCSSVTARAQVNVYTRSYDTSRTGANLQETILNPANVNATNFGKLWTFHTDEEIYAQPLYVSNLAIAGGTHNVVFVASMLNTVYALDADTGAQLWSQNFGSPIIPEDVEVDQNISWATRVGILGTPVIDPTSLQTTAKILIGFVTNQPGPQVLNSLLDTNSQLVESATPICFRLFGPDFKPAGRRAALCCTFEPGLVTYQPEQTEVRKGFAFENAFEVYSAIFR
jgi:PQQ enzyme repeat